MNDDSMFGTVTDVDDIKRWFDDALYEHATYMAVVVDTFDNSAYPENVFTDKALKELLVDPGELQKVKEVYDMSKPFDSQVSEDRAWNVPKRFMESFPGHAGRPGKRGGSVKADIVSKTIGATNKFGGSTISLLGEVPKTGYVVAGVRGEDGNKNERLIAKLDRPSILKYVADYHSELEKPNRYLGSWYDSGKTYLDTPEIHQDRETAIRLGHDREEIAIYDLSKKDSIYMTQDHQRPGESTAVTESSATESDSGGSYMLLNTRTMTPDQIADAILAQAGITEDK